MSEWKVEVVRVGRIEKHPNADSLSLTNVHGGYPVAFRTGDFEEGSFAVYVPIDSVVPDTEQWKFLDGHRHVKARKLRGIFSMGLLVPAQPGWEAGRDVAAEMNITRWEEPLYSVGVDSIDERCSFDFPVYTDVEALRRWSDVLVPGERVIATEKIHGCLRRDSKITMFDGSKKDICRVIVGDVVLGVDLSGNICPSVVTNTWDNGKTSSWRKIKLTRKKVKNGNSFCRVVCTDNHQIAVKLKNNVLSWKDASEVCGGDCVLIHRSDISIPEIQRQVLLGMMLGDAFPACGQKTDCAWSITWSHTIKDVGYVEWIERALGDVFKQGSRSERETGFGSKSLTGCTIWSRDIYEKFRGFKESSDKRKVVPGWVKDELTPLALAFWYMDDGSLGYGDGEVQDNTASFATCSFDNDDHKILLSALARLGINATMVEYDYKRIRLDTKNAEKLFLLIAPYIPVCMQRKLPLRYRGGQGWLPPVDAPQRYTQLVEQTVISNDVIHMPHMTSKCDLTTETHNFFANETLVHNSNCRAVWHDDRLWVGSHTRVKKRTDSSAWWNAVLGTGLEDTLRRHPDVVIFGESHGYTGGFPYDSTNERRIRFRAFDAMQLDTHTYFDWEEFQALVADLRIDQAPVLYDGPWDHDAIVPLAEGMTTLGGKHVREGFVVRPEKERYTGMLSCDNVSDEDRVKAGRRSERWGASASADPRGILGRTILKYHGEQFLTKTKGKR